MCNTKCHSAQSKPLEANLCYIIMATKTVNHVWSSHQGASSLEIWKHHGAVFSKESAMTLLEEALGIADLRIAVDPPKRQKKQWKPASTHEKPTNENNVTVYSCVNIYIYTVYVQVWYVIYLGISTNSLETCKSARAIIPGRGYNSKCKKHTETITIIIVYNKQ